MAMTLWGGYSDPSDWNQPGCGGPGGNKCGHNVTDNDEYIKKGE